MGSGISLDGDGSIFEGGLGDGDFAKCDISAILLRAEQDRVYWRQF
jgi:hypothetical protein